MGTPDMICVLVYFAQRDILRVCMAREVIQHPALKDLITSYLAFEVRVGWLAKHFPDFDVGALLQYSHYLDTLLIAPSEQYRHYPYFIWKHFTLFFQFQLFEPTLRAPHHRIAP